MRKPVTDYDRQVILQLHKFYGVNHIVFLMDYQYDADDVNQVLREYIAKLEFYQEDINTRLAGLALLAGS